MIHFNPLSTNGKAEISGSVPDQRLKVDTGVRPDQGSRERSVNWSIANLDFWEILLSHPPPKTHILSSS